MVLMKKVVILILLCFILGFGQAQNSNAIFDTIVTIKDSINDLPQLNLTNLSGKKFSIGRDSTNRLYSINYNKKAGGFNNAISLNGSNQYGYFSDSGLPGSGSAISVSLWFKKASLANEVTGSSLLTYGTVTGNSGGALNTYVLGSYLGVSITGVFNVGITTISQDTWHHLVISYNGSASFVMVDGILVASTNPGSTGASLIVPTGTCYLGYFQRYGTYYKGN